MAAQAGAEFEYYNPGAASLQPREYQAQVPSAQPGQYQTQPPYDRWTTGLFDCMDDLTSCFITYWLPFVTFGRIAEIVDRGSTSCGTSAALFFLVKLSGSASYTRYYRTKMRLLYNLPAEPCPDWVVNCFCEPCSICQEYRELSNRGFNMDIGWDGNVLMQTPGVTTIPPNLGDDMRR